MPDNPLWILQRLDTSSEDFAYVLKEGSYRIKLGRDIDCNVVCQATSISRNHCELVIDKDKIYIMDLGSRNGTFVNQSLILEEDAVPLENGSIISLGRPYYGGEIPLDQIVFKLTACKVVAPQIAQVSDERMDIQNDDKLFHELELGFTGFENDHLFKNKIDSKLQDIKKHADAVNGKKKKINYKSTSISINSGLSKQKVRKR